MRKARTADALRELTGGDRGPDLLLSNNYHDNSIKPAGQDRWLVRITDDWLPLPTELLKRLDLHEGEELECLLFHGDQLLIRKRSTTTQNP